jgi:DNA-binding MarR family transcriptional regulator
MPVYRAEIKRLSVKLLQKILYYSYREYKYLGKVYALQDLIVLSQIALYKELLSIKEWVNELDIRDTDTRKCINRLVLNGDIKKARNLSDARRYEISVTQRGQQILKHHEQVEEQILEFVLKDLTVNEEKSALKFLSKLNQLTVEKYHENNPLK